MTSLQNLPVHLQITGGLLVLLVLIFVGLFLLPGLRQWYRLARTQRSLSLIEKGAPLSEYALVFESDKRLKHLWEEFQDSLHKQHGVKNGVAVVEAARATVPADVYFSSHALVDSPLRADFFKHLPGIFTGLGIIGTFSGLINGLNEFKVSENAAEVRVSLEALLHAVGGAFLVSAAAIGAAMLVTFVEKLLIAAVHARAEAIALTIDARFDAGAGEEYLERLVKASEDSASQSKILKDALVRELGDVLRELSAAQLATSERLNAQLTEKLDAQVKVSSADQEALRSTLVAAITDSLKAPLEEIASTVRGASGDQSQAAIRMLQDVMASFSQRLSDLFGGQISGINEANRQASEGMQEAVRALSALVGSLEENGNKTASQITEHIEAALLRMEQQQSAIQTSSQNHLEDAIRAIGSQMGSILESLGNAQKSAFEAANEHSRSVTSSARELVEDMAGAMDQAAGALLKASNMMSASVQSLTSTTSTSIERMNQGAERLQLASTSFATAGDRVGQVMDKATTVGGRLTEVSGALTAGAGAVQSALNDYRGQREAMVTLMAETKVIVEHARREASVTADVLSRLEGSAQKFELAHKAADEYLDGISDVLATSSKHFQESVVSTLGRVNGEFHQQMTQAVSLLSGTIRELDDTLGGLVPER